MEIGKIEEKVQDSYALEEAEKEAANIYRRYSSDAKKPVEFKDDAVEIVGGYNVNSRFARLEICTIISRTGMTNRSPMNLAAEWEFHNLCYKCGIRPTSAEDATLDYGADPRWYVVLFSVYLENVGWV